jgi:hypothetical protein
MYRTPELDLPLDIDDIAGADPRSRGDTDRVPIPEIAQIRNGKPVYLADAFATRVNQQRVALDSIDDPGLQAALPSAALANGLCDVSGVDFVSPALP